MISKGSMWALGLALLGSTALLAPACGTETASAPAAPEEPPRAEPDWSRDERLRALLADCAKGGYFDRDTSDMTPVLVKKLETGHRDVLQAVKAELADIGQAALPELERLAREAATQRHGAHTVQNVLGVLWLSDAPGARPILASFLTHPQETVRAQALRGLSKHAGPEEFEALLTTLRITRGPLRATAVEALARADARRFEETFVEWLGAGEAPDMWSNAAFHVLAAADAETASALEAVVPDVEDAGVRIPLLGVLARAGRVDALEELSAELVHADPRRRTLALRALEHTGHPELAERVLRGDPLPSLRAAAVSLLAPLAEREQVRGLLRLALDDGEQEVRQAALAALLDVSDPEATDRLLAMLDRSRPEMQMALLAARRKWDAEPGLAERALEVLDRRQQEAAGLSPADRKPLIQAIGLVPGRASAELLVELGRAAEGELGGMPLHRLHVLNAGNTGTEGLAYLRERFTRDDDPERRMDYLWATTFGGDADTRAFLTGVVRSEETSPYEKLLAADRLVRLGPAAEVAPLLKRVTLREQHPEVRVALQCLLWQWYG